jgi:hypothetical protein
MCGGGDGAVANGVKGAEVLDAVADGVNGAEVLDAVADGVNGVVLDAVAEPDDTNGVRAETFEKGVSLEM